MVQTIKKQAYGKGKSPGHKLVFLFCKHSLERQTHGEVEREVAAEGRVHDGVMFAACLIGRVDGFHACVETQDKIVEVKTKAETVSHGYLLVKLVEAKLSARLLGVRAKGPNVACVYEEGAVKLPEQVCAQLGVEVELHVARLVYEVDASVGSLEPTRSELSHAPSAHGACSSREIAFLERQDVAVAVRISNAQPCMESERVVLVEGEEVGIVEIDRKSVV